MHRVLFIGFYFCGKYIYTDGDEKEVKRDMYADLPYFWGFYDQDGYESRKTILRISSDISL